MKTIDKSWVVPLQLGGKFLASGGGGCTGLLKQRLEEFFDSDRTVQLMEVSDLKDWNYYATICMIGSNEFADENPYINTGYINMLKQLKSITGKKYSGIFPLEAIDVNILCALHGAAMLDFPLVDADVMSRAFPELQMTTFHINKMPCNPCIFQTHNGEITEVFEDDTFLLELNIRDILYENGGMGFISGYSYNAKALKNVLIPGTVTFAKRVGDAIVNANNYDSLLTKLISISNNSIYGKCIELFKGKVKDIKHVEHMGGWNNIQFTGIDNYMKSTFSVLANNENLIGFRDNEIAAMVPDIITFFDLSTLEPIENDNVKPDMEIAIIGLPAPLILKTPMALEVVGPQSLGYKTKYRSLEELNVNYYFG